MLTRKPEVLDWEGSCSGPLVRELPELDRRIQADQCFDVR